MTRVERAIIATARRQHGVISFHQVLHRGAGPDLVRRRVQSGHWRRLAPSVYCIGAAPRTFQQRCMVAVLSAGAGALLSHRTAARLWGIWPRRTVPIEVSIPRKRNHQRRGVVVHTSRDLDRAQATTIDGIAVTGLARSLLDLGAVAPGRVRKAVWDARRIHDLPWPELLQTVVDHGRQGRNGVGPLRAVVADHYGEISRDSDTEDLAYLLMRDSNRLPKPEAQVPVMCADGVEVTIDFGWPRWRAYLEVFGGPHVIDEDLVQLDLHRRNQIVLAGNALHIATGAKLKTHPDQFISDVATMLRQHGWDGTTGIWSHP